MKGAFRFLASTLSVGFFAVLPILLCYLLLAQLIDMLMVLTSPIVDLLPDLSFAGISDRQLVAVVLLVVLLLVVGLLARTGGGQWAGRWLDRTLLRSLPLYELLRNLATRLSGDENVFRFRPALVTIRPGVRELGFVVEEPANGDYTVFMPSAPTPTIGSVRIISAENLLVLDVPAMRMLGCIASWGDGAAALLKAARPEKTGQQGRS